MTMHPNILIENQARVRVLRIHRPEKKNALCAEMYTALAEAVDAAAADGSVRALLFAGHPQGFCAGNDIDDFLNRPGEDASHPAVRFMRSLAAFPKPALAAVNGAAVGIGATLLLHCDLIYAGRSARFLFPFVNLGICPEFASTYLLPRFMGHARAAELLLLGEAFDADKAERYGMINAVVPDEEVEAHALEAARRLAEKPPAALRASKALLRRWPEVTIGDAIRDEGATYMPMLRQPEAREAMSAFLAKRKPDFTDFE